MGDFRRHRPNMRDQKSPKLNVSLFIVSNLYTHDVHVYYRMHDVTVHVVMYSQTCYCGHSK